MSTPDITITLNPDEADQVLRALAARKRQYRATFPENLFKDLLGAQQKVIVAINEADKKSSAPLDAPVQEPVVSTRKRRTPKKED